MKTLDSNMQQKVYTTISSTLSNKKSSVKYRQRHTDSKLYLNNTYFIVSKLSNNVEIGSFKLLSSISNTESEQNSKLKRNLEKLNSIAKLEQNWDLYGSDVIDERLINKVEKLLRSLKHQPEVFPTGNGGIQLDFFKDDDNFLEIEITIDEINLVRVIAGVDEECELYNINEVINTINEFYRNRR